MPQQNINPTPEPKSNTAIIVTIAVIIAVFISGGAVYAWHYFSNQEKDISIQKLEQQVNSLTAQVAQLQQEDGDDEDEQDDEENVNTYINEEYGFRFNYTSSYQITDDQIEVLDDREPVDGPSAFYGEMAQNIWQQRLAAKDNYQISSDCVTRALEMDGIECEVLSLEPYVQELRYSGKSELFFIFDKYQIHLKPSLLTEKDRKLIVSSFEIIHEPIISDFIFPENGSAIIFPVEYSLVKNTENNRRGSVYSYDFESTSGSYPSLMEIQFFTEDSIRTFNDNCEDFCFEGDFPNVEQYNNLKEAFNNGTDFQDYKLKEFIHRNYFVNTTKVTGDQGYIREYRTFIRNIMIDIWIYVYNEDDNDQADDLFSRIKIIPSYNFSNYFN